MIRVRRSDGVEALVNNKRAKQLLTKGWIIVNTLNKESESEEAEDILDKKIFIKMIKEFNKTYVEIKNKGSALDYAAFSALNDWIASFELEEIPEIYYNRLDEAEYFYDCSNSLSPSIPSCSKSICRTRRIRLP